MGAFGNPAIRDGLGEVGLGCMLVEESPGRRLDSIRPRAEIYLVEIEVENFVFAETLVDPVSEQGFLDFAGDNSVPV